MRLVGHVDAPGLALPVPPVSVGIPVPAALPAAVPVTAVPPPLLLVAEAAFAVLATLTPFGLLTTAWTFILGFSCFLTFCSACKRQMQTPFDSSCQTHTTGVPTKDQQIVQKPAATKALSQHALSTMACQASA